MATRARRCARSPGAYLLAPFPSCWCFAGLPAADVAAAWAAYGGVLAEAGADLGPGWDRAVAAALAGFLLNGAARAVTGGEGEDRGTTTVRPRVLAWSQAFPAAPAAEVFPALAAAPAASATGCPCPVRRPSPTRPSRPPAPPR